MNIRNKKWFTLVEVTVVGVIFVLLVVLANPAIQRIHEESRVKATQNILREYAQAAEEYFLEHDVTSVSVYTLIRERKYLDLSEQQAQAHVSLTNHGVIQKGKPIVMNDLDYGEISIDF